METWKALQLKHALEEFMTKVFEEADHINTRQFTRVRYVLELTYDPIGGSIMSSGIEVRKREEHAK